MARRVLLIVLVVGITVVGIPVSSAFAQVHSAHWYQQDAASGSHSVILNVVDGTDAIVAVAREKGVSITVVGIGTDLTFERNVLSCTPPSCWPPSMLLGIDKNMNGRYDADDFAWQWSLASGSPDPGLLHGDTFIQCENVASLLVPDAAFVLVNARTDYACFSPNIAGTAYDLTVLYSPGNLTLYQAGVATVGSGITPASMVVALKVLAGGATSWMNFSALVDLVTMGGSTRIDDPRNSRSHFEVDTAQ